MQPVSVADCFEALIKNEADAVALNEFTGRKAIKDLDLGSRVDVVQSRTLSIEGLHVLLHKSHPDASALIHYATLHVIPNAGHYPTLEQPDMINAALREWLVQPMVCVNAVVFQFCG